MYHLHSAMSWSSEWMLFSNLVQNLFIAGPNVTVWWSQQATLTFEVISETSQTTILFIILTQSTISNTVWVSLSASKCCFFYSERYFQLSPRVNFKFKMHSHFCLFVVTFWRCSVTVLYELLWQLQNCPVQSFCRRYGGGTFQLSNWPRVTTWICHPSPAYIGRVLSSSCN